MTKIAIIFFAALAFQAVLANSGQNQEQRNRQVQDLLKQLQSVGNETVTAIQNAQVEQGLHRRSLVSQANELAHNVHEASYHLQQAVDHNQEGQGQQVLQEVVRSLSNIVHSLQQALNNEPTQLKAQLKTQLENVVVEAQKLGPVAQQKQLSQHINDEVEDVLDDLLAAVHQLQVRNRLLSETQEQIKSKIQAVTKQVSDVIQSVSSDDEATAQELAHHSHHLAHQLGHIIHNLQTEVYNQDDDRVVLQQVINHLSEVRAALEQAKLTGDSVSELKSLLKTNLHNVADQIETLVPAELSSNSTDREAQDLKNVLQGVLARSLVAVRQLQRNVEATVRDNQQN